MLRRAVLLSVVPLLLASACSDDDEGESVVGLTESAVGTCLDFGDTVDAEVSSLPVVECDVPHSHEIYAVVASAEAVYPGFEALETEAQAVCLDAFEPYVDISPFDSTLFYSWLVPTLESWDEGDDEIVCVVGLPDGGKLERSVEGTGI